jgi:calcium channel MID1
MLAILLLTPAAALSHEIEREASSLLDWTSPVAPPQLVARSHPLYEPEFALLDRGIVGRAPLDAQPLQNNAPTPLNLAPGSSACYVVQKSVIFGGSENAGSSTSSRELKRDEDVEARADHAKQPSNDKSESSGTPTKTLYLSANTCLQPQIVSSKGASEAPPQLRIYISTSSKDGCPDPTKPAAGVQSKAFEQGAVMYGLNATGDVYVTVAAPDVTDKFQGIYNFEIAASTDAYYYQYSSQNGQLLWMDSDATSALLQTASLTNDRNKISSIIKGDPQYDLFVQATKAPVLDGLMRSVCGMNNVAQIASKRLDNGQMNNNEMVRTKMTDKGPGGWPRQQFYFQGLNSSTSYYGILVKHGNSTASSKRQSTGVIGGGGIVFPPTDFQTSAGMYSPHVRDGARRHQTMVGANLTLCHRNKLQSHHRFGLLRRRAVGGTGKQQVQQHGAGQHLRRLRQVHVQQLSKGHDADSVRGAVHAAVLAGGQLRQLHDGLQAVALRRRHPPMRGLFDAEQLHDPAQRRPGLSQRHFPPGRAEE